MTELLANSPVPGIREPVGELVEELTAGATGAKALKLKATIAKDTGLRAAGEARVVIDREIIRFKTETGEPTEYEILERAAEESVAAAHAAGTKVYCLPTVGSLEARYNPAPRAIPVGTTNAPFVVQKVHGERASSGVLTLSLGKATTFGNSLLVLGSSENCKGNITAIKDTAGNTWTKLSTITSEETTELCLDLWVAPNIAAATTKVEITTSQTAGAYTAEVVEFAGVLELDSIQTANTAASGAGVETEAVVETVSGSLFLKHLSIANCEALEKLPSKGIGMQVSCFGVPETATVTKVETAKGEVKISVAATESNVGQIASFFAQIVAPALTFTTGDVVVLNYSAQVPPGVPGSVTPFKPAGAKLLERAFNTNGITAYWFATGSPATIEVPANSISAGKYSLQVASFKFAPNNRGVAGTNATGELLGKVATTGKMDPTIQTAIPSFVAVIASAWTNFANAQLNEETTELVAAGSLQIRFESTATQARIRGTIKVKALQEVKEGARILTTPTSPNYHPIAEQRVGVSFGKAATELNTVTVGSINTAGEMTLPKATKVAAGEVISIDGTYALT